MLNPLILAPVIEVGKYRLINLALMNKMALEVEFAL